MSTLTASADPAGHVHIQTFPPRRKMPMWSIWALLAIALVITFWLIFLGTRPAFVVETGDSMISHLETHQAAIKAAKKVGLPVYMVNSGTKTRITYADALRLEKQTDIVRVVVPLYAGDRVDLRWSGKFIPAAGKPDAKDR